jgi:hypothetical protein
MGLLAHTHAECDFVIPSALSLVYLWVLCCALVCLTLLSLVTLKGKGKGKVTPKQAYVVLRGSGG